jgi:hypothetical protein
LALLVHETDATFASHPVGRNLHVAEVLPLF